MSKLLVPAVVAVLLACASAGPPGSSGVGQIVAAGVVPGTGEVPTVHWQYRFRFDVDPGTVTLLKLSCGDLAGSTLLVKPFEINLDAQRMATFRALDRPLNAQAVPWLFDASATNATCLAVISRDGQPDALEQFPITIPAEAKQQMLALHHSEN
jgi:hypothetical protein